MKQTKFRRFGSQPIIAWPTFSAVLRDVTSMPSDCKQTHVNQRGVGTRNNTWGPAATVYRLQKVLILRSVLIKWQQGVVRSIPGLFWQCWELVEDSYRIEYWMRWLKWVILWDGKYGVMPQPGALPTNCQIQKYQHAIDSFTVPLHSPAVRAVQPLGTVTGVWKPVGIPTGHMSPKSSK